MTTMQWCSVINTFSGTRSFPQGNKLAVFGRFQYYASFILHLVMEPLIFTSIVKSEISLHSFYF